MCRASCSDPAKSGRLELLSPLLIHGIIRKKFKAKCYSILGQYISIPHLRFFSRIVLLDSYRGWGSEDPVIGRILTVALGVIPSRVVEVPLQEQKHSSTLMPLHKHIS